ncbi:Nn.00g051800.m01.CDS01 [Neocucurbitaria sp. VM-36]
MAPWPGPSQKSVKLLHRRNSIATATNRLQQLIRSPGFNRAVQKAYRKINRLPDFEQKNGGSRTGPSALDHFKDELKTQLRELTWQKRPPK